MRNNFQAPSGTPEHLPLNAERLSRADRRIMAALRAHGYPRVQVPMYEPFALYEQLYGEDIRRHLITFDTDREYALRPDLTAGVSRLYASRLSTTPVSPLRAAASGSAFRHERVRALRLREFHQIGLERFGDTDETAAGGDLEILSLARITLAELGLAGGLLRIGHAALRQELLEALPLPAPARQEVSLTLDALTRLRERLDPPRTQTDLRLTEDGQRERINPYEHPDLSDLLAELGRKLKPSNFSRPKTMQAKTWLEALEAHLAQLCEPLGQAGQEAMLRMTWPSASVDEMADAALPVWPEASARCHEALQHIESCQQDLEPCVLRFGLGASRWGGFYTGFYFEIDAPVLGPDVSQIMGGGRYDGLMTQLGAPSMGACGFALGLERALEAARLLHGDLALDKRLMPARPVLVCFTDKEGSAQRAANLAEELGSRGCAIAYHPVPITEQHPQGGFTDAFLEALGTLPGTPYQHAILMDETPWVGHLDNGSCFEANMQTLLMMFARQQ